MTDNTKTFYLKEHEWKFISEHCPSLNLNNNLLRNGNIIILTLDASEQKNLIDSLDNLLISVGLDEEDEPNNLGLQIEYLIDIFNPYKK